MLLIYDLMEFQWIPIYFIKADNLADSLSPIFESVEGKEEMGLAYVIRGQRNIIEKMKGLISLET